MYGIGTMALGQIGSVDWVNLKRRQIKKICSLVAHTEMVAGVYLHDPTALLVAVNPSLMTFTEGAVRVQTAGITKGLMLFRSNNKRSGLSLSPSFSVTKC